MLTTYIARCHCGAVEIEADLDLEQSTYRCNCSICKRTRFWPAIAKEDGFRILKGEDQLTRYTFITAKTNITFASIVACAFLELVQKPPRKNVRRKPRLYRFIKR